MKKPFALTLAFLLAFSLIVVFIKIPVAQASTSTFSSSSSDAGAWESDSTYATVHDQATGVTTDGSASFTVGQNNATGTYSVYRGYVYFDTSSIPDIATIDSAVLSLYVYSDSSTDDFNVTVQTGAPTYPHDPIQSGDYYYNYYSGDGGSRNTTEISGVGYWNITLSAEALDWIVKTGTTKLCLRSNKDIDSTAPATAEGVVFYTSEGGQVAKLYVEYTVGTYYEYTLHGPFDEETGVAVDENVTVNVYRFENQPKESFEFNGTYLYNSSYLIQYFIFNFTGGGTREYWVDPSESMVGTIYIFYGNSTELIETYTINFMDTAGILNSYPYVTVKRYVNGTLFTVEKRKVDAYCSILANLIQGRTYTIYLGNEDVTYVFGDLTMTSQTSIQLVLRSVDFPTDTDWALLYKYVRIYGYRNFTAGSITINYEDTKEATTSVEVVIRNSSDTCYSNTFYSNSFSATWTGAVNGVTYYVEVTIDHGDYGTVEWRQTFPATSDVTPPFSLAFLGDWGFESEYLVPSLIVLCVAGCFSKLNAYVGAILMMITASALAWAGWFPVPASMLVFGFTLAILMALVYYKRGAA